MQSNINQLGEFYEIYGKHLQGLKCTFFKINQQFFKVTWHDFHRVPFLRETSNSDKLLASTPR